ncbi:AIR synthase-related protein [Candidatus Leptofilum sp.]|uniref:AIR synthase-related protein n=1 Tax=Candidatus Leptofilum sp. TaxID=3241576 RepID=UPI003B594891
MHKTFQATINYTAPPPGQTRNSRLQIINGLHNNYIWAATEQLNKSQLFNKLATSSLLPDLDSSGVQGRLPTLPIPPLEASWEPTNPADVTLPPGKSCTLAQRLVSLLVHAKPPKTGASSQPKAKNIAFGSSFYPGIPDLDLYMLAWATVDRAVSSIVAAGADPDQIAILADFSVGELNTPEQLGGLVRSVQGCHDAAVSLQTPFAASKYRLNEDAPGGNGFALHITALGIVPDKTKAVTADLKQAGNFIFVVGDTRAELGGSHFNQAGGRAEGSRTVPKPVADSRTRMQRLHQAIQEGIVQACHLCGEGGVAATLAQMCIAGRMGAELQLIHVPRDWHAAYSTDEVILFAESLSRFLVEVRPEDAPRFRTLMADVPHECVAVIGGEQLLVNGRTGTPILNLTVEELTQT